MIRFTLATLALLAVVAVCEAGGYGAPRAPVYVPPPQQAPDDCYVPPQQAPIYAPPQQAIVRQKTVVVRQQAVYAPPVLAAPVYAPQQAVYAPSFNLNVGKQRSFFGRQRAPVFRQRTVLRQRGFGGGANVQYGFQAQAGFNGY